MQTVPPYSATTSAFRWLVSTLDEKSMANCSLVSLGSEKNISAALFYKCYSALLGCRHWHNSQLVNSLTGSKGSKWMFFTLIKAKHKEPLWILVSLTAAGVIFVPVYSPDLRHYSSITSLLSSVLPFNKNLHSNIIWMAFRADNNTLPRQRLHTILQTHRDDRIFSPHRGNFLFVFLKVKWNHTHTHIHTNIHTGDEPILPWLEGVVFNNLVKKIFFLCGRKKLSESKAWVERSVFWSLHTDGERIKSERLRMMWQTSWIIQARI